MIDFDKLPATLQVLVKLCCQTPNNAAHLGPLTDYLKDAPPEECRAALSFLAEQSYKLTALNAKLATKPNSRRFAIESRLSRIELLAAKDGSFNRIALAVRQMQERLGDALIPALEEGHWFALRIERTQGEDPATRFFEIRLEAMVSPMDGGQIRGETT